MMIRAEINIFRVVFFEYVYCIDFFNAGVKTLIDVINGRRLTAKRH